ncbi:MAG: trypsin-like peptidase domain-containing protein [Candidatus Moraniibacteriota bacterium]
MNERDDVIVLGEAGEQKKCGEKKCHESGRSGKVVLAGIVGGFSGALIVAGLFGLLLSHGKLRLPSSSEEKAITEQQRIVSESDGVVVDTIAKSMPGVVSIVISKDVPKLRSFQSPFGGLPFFFDNPTLPGSGGSQKQQIGSGSGFFVSEDGLIVTNKHVVADLQADYTVLVGEKEYDAKVLARDPSNDIALLKIEGNGFTALPLGDSEVLKVGETVLAVGNPLGEFANSVSRGIISGLKRTLTAGSGRGDTEQLLGIIQTDAAINPGNSGGPLLNISGEVVGIDVAMAQGAENIGFAIPINQVKKVIDQVKTTGKISTAYLGVRYMPIDDDLKKEANLPFDYGVLVARGETVRDFAVMPGSPADKAGIVENDILLEVNGTKIDADHSLVSLLAQYSPNDTVTLKIWHKGDTKDISVTLDERK